MNYSTYKNILALSLSLLLWSCGKGFESGTKEETPEPVEVFSANSLNDFKLEILDGSFKPITKVNSLRAGVNYNFSVGFDSLPADSLITWSLPVNQAGCDLRVDKLEKTAVLSCTSDGNVKVQISALTPDGKTIDSSASGYIKGAGLIILPPAKNFSIPANTGTKAWNTSTTTVTSQLFAFVGQILRIKNDDSVDHKPVTVGDAPCESAALSIKPGQSYDCVITKEVTYGANITDELNPTTGKLFLVTMDAGKFFASQNCTACHGAKTGMTRAQFDAKVTNDNALVPKGPMAIYTNLNHIQREALVYYLNN